MTLYEKMVAIAESQKANGYLRAYEADLTTHDKALLASAQAGMRFIWTLRECGTGLFEIASGRDPAWATYWLDNAHNPPNLVYLADVDADTVRPISYERARKLAHTPHPDGKVIRFSLS